MANAVRRAELEKKVLKALLEEQQKLLVDEVCGERYSRGNEKMPCERAGTTTRTISTLVGQVTIDVTKVRIRTTRKFRTPLWDHILLAERRIYQDDVCAVGCEFVTKMTYRDAVMEAKRLLPEFPGRNTIQRRLVEFGLELDAIASMGDEKFPIVMVDGTKVRNMDRRGHHEVGVILGVREDGHASLLRVSVNEDPNHAVMSIKDRLEAQVIAVTDGEPALRNVFAELDVPAQQCLIHVLRNVHYAMWKDKATRDERLNVKRELARLLLILRRSVKKHKRDKDWDRLAWRRDETLRQLKELAENLFENGWTTAGAFIKNEADAIVLFARYAPDDIEVPWSTNLIERLMGEISKRTKHKWMHWSDVGLEALLIFLLTRLKNAGAYDTWWRQKTQDDDGKKMTATVAIIAPFAAEA